MPSTISNPLAWGADHIWGVARHLGSVVGRLGSGDAAPDSSLPQIKTLSMEDLRTSLQQGMEDFMACRTDVAFLCLLYPIIGLCLAWFAFDNELLPLLFPTMTGFALIGPLAAVGLYEMSRRREQGQEARWTDAIEVIRSPSFGAILVMGILLFCIFFIWLLAAHGIYNATLGPESPESLGSFIVEVLTTGAGWAMIIGGMFVGFLFATLVLATSVVSFPLLLDRPVGLPVAVMTSIRVSMQNPGPIGAWGVIVATMLALGSIPFFIGLIVVLPLLGHSTWHLYRKAVAPPAVSNKPASVASPS